MDKDAKLSMTHNLNLLAFLIPLVGQGDQEGQVGQGSSTGKPEPLGVPTTAGEGHRKAVPGRVTVLPGKGLRGSKHRISSTTLRTPCYMRIMPPARYLDLSVFLTAGGGHLNINSR